MILASTAGFAALVIGVPWWLMRRDRQLGRTAAVGMLVGLVITLALQLLVLRPRPLPTTLLLPMPPLPSFPSGHAVLTAIAIVLLAAHRRRLALAALPVAAAVAFSRIHLGHHHLSDVLGGVLVGLGLAAGLWVRARSAPDDPWRLRWLLWPQLGMVVAISLVAYTGTFSRGNIPWLTPPGMDKVLHLLSFGLLAFGAHFATRGRTLRWGRGRLQLRLPLAIALPMLGALAEELLQASSPHRTADPLDLTADLVGMLGFWALARRITSTPHRAESRTVSSHPDPRWSND